jgi:hypothetical protein
MKKTLWQAIGQVALLGVLVLLAVALFQAARSGGVGGAPAATQAQGYPPPQGQILAPTATKPAQGYPAPQGLAATTIYETQVAQATKMVATLAAEIIMTSRAPTPTSPWPLVGPQIITDSTGQFSLNLPSGWYATTLGGVILTNYDADKVVDVNNFAPGDIKIQMGIGKLPAGQTFEEWQKGQIARDTTPDPNSGWPGQTATTPLPYTLEHYNGFTYFLSGPPRILVINLSLDNSRVVSISLMPADSSALNKALTMLTTLEVKP